jgi:uncharacterized protein YkwD
MRQVNQLTRILPQSALVLLLLPGIASSGNRAQPTQSTGVNGSVSEQFLLDAANRDRVSRGLKPVLRDPVLAQAALYHARIMAQHADISHGFPGEPDLAARAANAGVHFSLVTENVAEAPDPTEIHEMWMHSEHHRENLLDPDVNVIGISVVQRNGQFYAVEDFASTIEVLTLDQQESTVAGLVHSTGLNIDVSEPSIRSARATCSMPTGYAEGGRKPWFVMRYTASNLSQLPTTLRTRISTGKYHEAVVGACGSLQDSPFTAYNIAVLLYP